MEKDEINSLAERLVRAISSDSKSTDLSSIRKSIDAIGERLDRLESYSNSKFKFQIPNSIHPSQDRFAIAEAIVEGLFDQTNKEKACTFEPLKPCDHCSMCNSRGF